MWKKKLLKVCVYPYPQKGLGPESMASSHEHWLSCREEGEGLLASSVKEPAQPGPPGRMEERMQLSVPQRLPSQGPRTVTCHLWDPSHGRAQGCCSSSTDVLLLSPQALALDLGKDVGTGTLYCVNISNYCFHIPQMFSLGLYNPVSLLLYRHPSESTNSPFIGLDLAPLPSKEE